MYGVLSDSEGGETEVAIAIFIIYGKIFRDTRQTVREIPEIGAVLILTSAKVVRITDFA